MSDAIKFSTLRCCNGTEIGVAELNRPSLLNVISHEMNETLTGQLQRWEKMPHITLVVLHGAGKKAFCAGGDTRPIYQALGQQKPPDEGVRAMLIDKDRQPRWQPATLNEVTPQWIERHFERR